MNANKIKRRRGKYVTRRAKRDKPRAQSAGTTLMAAHLAEMLWARPPAVCDGPNPKPLDILGLYAADTGRTREQIKNYMGNARNMRGLRRKCKKLSKRPPPWASGG